MFTNLLKRDYYRLLGKKYGNDIFKVGGPKNLKKKYHKDFNLFKKWADGRTGIPYIDANIRKLTVAYDDFNPVE